MDERKYALKILRRAAKELESLPQETYDRINESIRRLAFDPYPNGSIKLVGREGFRLRVGKYRVIYDVDSKTRNVIILDIGHRKDIYKR